MQKLRIANRTNRSKIPICLLHTRAWRSWAGSVSLNTHLSCTLTILTDPGGYICSMPTVPSFTSFQGARERAHSKLNINLMKQGAWNWDGRDRVHDLRQSDDVKRASARRCSAALASLRYQNLFIWTVQIRAPILIQVSMAWSYLWYGFCLGPFSFRAMPISFNRTVSIQRKKPQIPRRP